MIKFWFSVQAVLHRNSWPDGRNQRLSYTHRDVPGVSILSILNLSFYRLRRLRKPGIWQILRRNKLLCPKGKVNVTDIERHGSFKWVSIIKKSTASNCHLCNTAQKHRRSHLTVYSTLAYCLPSRFLFFQLFSITSNTNTLYFITVLTSVAVLKLSHLVWKVKVITVLTRRYAILIVLLCFSTSVIHCCFWFFWECGEICPSLQVKKKK
jgi:hypothetical protein